MWILATYRYPDYTYEQLKLEMDQLYYEVWPQMREELHPMDQVKVLNTAIFEQLKFGPNSKNFHAANNSFINNVLSSKKGNPISLCVIYMWIAQKLSLPIYGVNLPEHFILAYRDEFTIQQEEEEEPILFYINPFSRGAVFSRREIDTFLKQLKLEQNRIFYESCSNVDIVCRQLRNLIVSYEKLGYPNKVDDLKKLLHILSYSG
jgi:regulator of sirC expression with transglutaminase-like and TPR domain